MRWGATIGAGLVLAVFPFAAATAKPPHAHFVGELIVNMNDDPRKVILVGPFSYVGPDGRVWPVPAGWKVDGASIPQPLWSLVGSPFTGSYRKASVIHDYYCDTKTRSWRAVHRVFYDAMITGGVSEDQAKLMYAAVYYFGPKWETKNGVDGAPVVHTWQPPFDEARYQDLQAWVKAENPSLKEIEALVK